MADLPAERAGRSLIGSVTWYKNRVAAMSLGEIGHRMGEQLKRRASRRSHAAADAAADAELRPWPGLDSGLRALADDRELRAVWRAVARQVTEGPIRLLGMEWPVRRPATDWHLDPASGDSWPAERYCFDIPYRRQTRLGDVKYVWELNRLQHLQPVAALAALEGDRELARSCCAEIDSWIDANPRFRGINWASGIELALRVVSILLVASLLDPKGLLDIDRRKLAEALAAHGYWIRRFPSRFSSANNHRVAEAGALFLLGTLAPGLPGAADWADCGRSVLLDESQKQILADGVGAEQSPTYTAFTLEWLLLCGVVAGSFGHAFPEEFWTRMAAAGQYLRAITDRSGGQPRIGDDDEGRVVWTRPDRNSHVSAVLGSLAATLARPDLAPPAAAPDLRDTVFGRPPAAVAPASGVKHFPAGGYTVARSGHRGHESLLVFDHGPLGYLSIAAHGHADALALWLHLDGRPLLVDAGTYLYHGGGRWRDHFRGTAAHNTLSIAGADSSRMAGAFNWSEKAATTVLSRHVDGDRWHVEAEHDGFLRGFGVRHRRRVECLEPGCLQVTDSLHGGGGAFEVEIGFLLHPSLSIGLDGSRATVRCDGEALLAIEAEAALAPSVQRGQIEPARGWYSPAFSQKLPTFRLLYAGRLAVGATARFTLWPLPEPTALDARTG